MHAPLKCSEMLPLEIWNGIISNRHDDIHAPQCDHRHWMLVNMQRAPPVVAPGFSDPTEDTAVPRWRLSPWATWTESSGRCHRRRCRRTRATSRWACSPAGTGCGKLQACILGRNIGEARLRFPRRIITVMMLGRQSGPPLLQTWTGCLLKHQELISRPVAALLQRSAKHENVYLFIFLLMLSPDDIIIISNFIKSPH